MLSLLFMSFLTVGVSTIVRVAYAEDAFDITSYDAESQLIGFIPYADSGLDSIAIHKYPQKQLIVSYDGTDNPYDSTARVNFKIGEWKYLGCNRDEVEEIQLDEDTKLMKSEFWFETDLISWTDLDYMDVFSDGKSSIETQKEVRWFQLKKRHGWGWDPFFHNSGTRISAWNDDLLEIYKKIGSSPSNAELYRYVKFWIWEDKPYCCLEGLRQLLKDPVNYMPQHYNKYIRWNQLNFPGNPINLRDFTLKRYNDFSIKGDIFFDISLKENFWNRLSFPQTVEVKDDGTGDPIGRYDRSNVIFSIDNGMVLGQNDPNYPESRTRIVDLQEIYENNSAQYYSPHSAIGNMLATNPHNLETEITTNAVEKMEMINNPNKRRSEIPADVIGDGQCVQGIIERSADWSWEDHDIDQGPNAHIPGTSTLQPFIWESETTPDIITAQDLYNLKPLDKITSQDLYFGHQLKDRSRAVLKIPISYGPHLHIDYSELKIKEISLSMANGLWWGYHKHWSVSDYKNITHVPYSANVRNIGLCQTLRIKVVALSTYEYEPYGSSEPGEISPQFPLDDSHVEWPSEVDDGGDIAFSMWEEHPDLFDAILGFIITIFGSLFNFLIFFVFALIGIGLFVLWFITKALRRRGGKGAIRNMEELQRLSLELQKSQLQNNLSRADLRYIQTTHHPKSSKYILATTITFGLVITAICFTVLF
jgi:hypothetical protein